MRAKGTNPFRIFITSILRTGLILALCLGVSGAPAARAEAGFMRPVSLAADRSSVQVQANAQSGWFSIIWGDGQNGATQTTYTLTDDKGRTTLLQMDEAFARSVGGVLQFDRQYVNVQGPAVSLPSEQGGGTALQVTAISSAKEPLGSVSSKAVTGSKPWVTIMCKFSDHAEEPNTLAYFQGMYSSSKPGLDHYWRELSYDALNVVGSNAFGWFVLPHPESYYNPTDASQGADKNLMANDCTAAADASVYFPTYSGINMMFNTDFDNGWAWGGGHYMTLDGLSQVWRMTWEPPWSYADISVIEHEMGHGWGLPHSSGNYGATYDNAWDVMSKDRYNCAAADDPTYGCMAQHTISYHLDILGWIPSGQKFTAGAGTNATITLERLALPATSNYKMAQIPIGGSSTHFYTLEARQLTGYDIKLAGAAVIIHEVDLTRGIPAHVLDPDLNGNTGDAGAMWTVGETFTDAANGISVYVSSATASGFTVTLASSPLWTISGQVRTPGGIGVGGVTLSGLPGSPVTDAGGYYTDKVLNGWSGTVTPTRSPLTFNPASITYTSVTSDRSNQDYIDTYTDIFYVKTAASGGGTCQDWDNACTLQTALATAAAGTEIWAAAGTYKPTSGTERAATFQLVAGVALYGGFAGTETLRTQRNPAANPTILSGDISILGDTNDNSYHVVTGATSAVLDGFTVTAGNANGISFESIGGGMMNNASNPTVSNVIFNANSATLGGGMGNYSSSPTLTEVTFISNTSTDAGGGMFNQGSNPSLTGVAFTGNTSVDGAGMYNTGSNPVLTNGTLSGNTASNDGGGMENYSSNPSMTNMTFSGNTAARYGGGMSNWYGTPSLTNVTIAGGSAVQYGGGVFNYGTSPTLINVTITSNSGQFGSAIFNYSSSSPTIRNTIVWGNTSTYGAQVYDDGTGVPVVSYSVVQGGYSGATNISTDPLLGTLGAYSGSSQTIPLLPGSSAINTGNNTGCPSIDQRDVARPQGGVCDIGAFESRPFALAIASGDAQSAIINTAFAQVLALNVTGTGGDPVNGGLVTYSAPGSGASASLSSSAVTISGGSASTNATANGTAGSYQVSANAAGVSVAALFDLTNSPLTATSTSTPSATFTRTSSPSPSATFTQTSSATPSATFTRTSSPTSSPTRTHTSTSTPSATFTRTSSPTRTRTVTTTTSPSITKTPTQTPSVTRTPTGTLPTATRTFTPSRTYTPNRTSTTTRTTTQTPTSGSGYQLYLPLAIKETIP
jgi:hypothetical protein